MADRNYRFLPVDEVIANITLDSDNEDSRDEAVFAQWIYRAVRMIGYVKANIREKTVTVDNQSVEIPCDLAEIIQFSVLDLQGNLLAFNWHTVGGFSGEMLSGIVVSENETHYDFSSNSSNAHSVQLKYWAHPVDEEGNLLIPEIFLEAILAFCDYRWTERQRKRKPKEVPVSEVAYKKNEWSNLRREAASEAKLPPMMEAEAISRQHTSAMPNRNRRPLNFSRR